MRKLFTAKTKTGEAVAERQAATYRNVLGSPGYFFFVYVDAEALDECLRYDGLPEATQLKFWNRRRDPALGRARYANIIETVVEVSGTPQDGDDDDDKDNNGEKEAISFKAHWPCFAGHQH